MVFFFRPTDHSVTGMYDWYVRIYIFSLLLCAFVYIFVCEKYLWVQNCCLEDCPFLPYSWTADQRFRPYLRQYRQYHTNYDLVFQEVTSQRIKPISQTTDLLSQDRTFGYIDLRCMYDKVYLWSSSIKFFLNHDLWFDFTNLNYRDVLQWNFSFALKNILESTEYTTQNIAVDVDTKISDYHCFR